MIKACHNSVGFIPMVLAAFIFILIQNPKVHAAPGEEPGAGVAAYTSPDTKQIYARPDTARDLEREHIRRKVASKTSLPRVIRTASAFGLDPFETATIMLRAGASPQLTIYFAITEGLDAGEVASAAILQGVDAELVMRSAINAGAEPLLLARAIVELGASPVDVAEVVARVTAPPRILP